MPINFDIFRSQLEKEQKLLNDQMEQLEANVLTADEKRESTPFGKRDQGAVETLELEKRLVMEKRIKSQLAEVERALRKFEEGTYGLCDACGKSIDPERLEALPQANLCMLCKAKPRAK
ncbi:MAG: TraR/DksA C4-type zinc finger protein [Chloroflexota bacterium]